MQKLSVHLWYDKEAKEAAKFYLSVFKDAKIKNSANMHNTPSGDTNLITMEILGQEIMLISAGQYFKFNEAVSLVVGCDTQEEIDYYWEKLSADPKAEECGWPNDKFGLSWQIVPNIMATFLSSGDRAAIDRVTKAFLQMKKFDIAELERAYAGK